MAKKGQIRKIGKSNKSEIWKTKRKEKLKGKRVTGKSPRREIRKIAKPVNFRKQEQPGKLEIVKTGNFGNLEIAEIRRFGKLLMLRSSDKPVFWRIRNKGDLGNSTAEKIQKTIKVGKHGND